MQIAFYFETGGEIKWGAAKNFAHDPAGMKVLLSGGMQACLMSASIVLFARLISVPLYNGADCLRRNISKTFMAQPYHAWTAPGEPVENILTGERRSYCDSVSTDEGDEPSIGRGGDLEAASEIANSQPARWYLLSTSKVAFIAPIITIAILLLVRPKTFPYAHMSGSLPFTLADIWESKAGFCQAGLSEDSGSFPLPDLISNELWEYPHGKFPGWMPTANISSSDQKQQLPRPPWLPDDPIHGFERWYNDLTPESFSFSEQKNHHQERKGRMKRGPAYDPSKDVLKISNLDQDILEPLTEALQNRKVQIKHVVLLSLESTRSDVYPFKKDSHLYDVIMKSHQSKESVMKADSSLPTMTLNAELLTGEDGGFEMSDQNVTSSRVGSWRNLDKDRGGINVQGAFTGSTTSLKSILGSHCGVQPLPVDFTVEAHRGIYQPCLPNILDLFNKNKEKSRIYNPGHYRKDDANSMPWKSVYAQSMTDQYDHQDNLNRQMGFSEVITKETLLDPSSKNYPPTEKESNYFGFPETQLKPNLQGLFRDAEKNKQRIFLSHLTSSSHHPWNLPESESQNVDYLERGRWGSEPPLNRYLNTIRYTDRWIGEIMDMLEDFGVAEETLVVIVGDHGMAFEEDSPVYTTFENGHIKNLAVPLVFHHPLLPRIQLDVNATSLSIIPTILDLLISTSSLNAQDLEIASNLIHQYEGQSLLRPYRTEKNGRQAWNIAVLNAGGAVLSVSSAAMPFRLVIPVCKAGVYRFTSTASDPNELAPMEEYSVTALAARVRRQHGDAAAKWVIEAEKIGKWWVFEQKIGRAHV